MTALEAKPTGTEILKRVVDARGVLLRAEHLVATGASPTAVVLTFDVARILLSANPDANDPDANDPGAGNGLAIVLLENPDDSPSECVDAGEEEPWWRLLGAPLTHVDAGDRSAEPSEGGPAEARSVSLQFGTDAENARVVSIASRGAVLRIELEHFAN